MKNIMLIFFLPISLNGICQLNGTVIDKESNNPIPYTNIWIENEYIGTTSDINGKFRLEEDHQNKNLVISAVGYESQTLLIDSSFLEINLVPRIYQIPEVNIKHYQKKKELIISRLNKLRRSSGVTAPHIYARYFPYRDEYKDTPFLKSIKFKTRSIKMESCFNLRFLSVNKNGEPGEDILSDNIIVNAKRGVRNIVIKNFNNKTILIPENGMFIAIEFLIVKENSVVLELTEVNTQKKEKVTCYMPLIARQQNDYIENGWDYYRGKWYNNQFGKVGPSDSKNNYRIAMEVVLSN